MPTLVNDVKQITKLIKSAHTNSAKFAEILHDAAYNCIMHAVNTGDIRPLQVLYDGLTARSKDALQIWTVKLAPITFAKGIFKVKKDRTQIDRSMLEISGPMDYKPAKKSPEKAQFNLADEIAKLLAKAEKHAANAEAMLALKKAGQLA